MEYNLRADDDASTFSPPTPTSSGAGRTAVVAAIVAFCCVCGGIAMAQQLSHLKREVGDVRSGVVAASRSADQAATAARAAQHGVDAVSTRVEGNEQATQARIQGIEGRLQASEADTARLRRQVRRDERRTTRSFASVQDRMLALEDRYGRVTENGPESVQAGDQIDASTPSAHPATRGARPGASRPDAPFRTRR